MSQEILLLTNPDSNSWQQAEELEADVFIERGYVEDKNELDEEYYPYKASSKFVVVYEHNQPVGSARIIVPSSIGLKTIHDIASHRLNLDDNGQKVLESCDITREVVEVGTLGIPQEHRTNPYNPDSISNILYCGVIDTLKDVSKKAGSDPDRYFVLAGFDERYFNIFKRLFKESVMALGTACDDYMGSPTIPTLIDCHKMTVIDGERKKPLLKWLERLTLHED